MKICFVLYCKPAGTYKSNDGEFNKDLNKAALFSGEQAAKHSEQFSPNFEFLTVKVINGVRTLEY